jgi:Polysaccharide deacetylase
VPTAYVGTDRVFPWDRALPRMANLSWDEVREIAGMGHEIGSHTVNHVDLGVVSSEEARWELFESKAVVEKQLNRPVRWFAYPYGGKNNLRPEAAALVEEAGYKGCLSGYGGFVRPGTDPRILPRDTSPIYQELLNLELHLRGCLNWFYAFKQPPSPPATSKQPIDERLTSLEGATAAPRN